MAHIELLMKQSLLNSKPIWFTHPRHTCNIYLPSNAYSNRNFILFSGLEIMSGYFSSLNVAQTVRLLVTQQRETSSEDMILALAGQFKQLSHEPEKFR